MICNEPGCASRVSKLVLNRHDWPKHSGLEPKTRFVLRAYENTESSCLEPNLFVLRDARSCYCAKCARARPSNNFSFTYDLHSF